MRKNKPVLPSTYNTFFLAQSGTDDRSSTLTSFYDSNTKIGLKVQADVSIENSYFAEGIENLERAIKKITHKKKVFAQTGDAYLTFKKTTDPRLDERGFIISRLSKENIEFRAKTEIGLRYAIAYFTINFLDFLAIQPNRSFTSENNSKRISGYSFKSRDQIFLPEFFTVVNPGPDFQLRIWTGHSGFDRTDWLQDEAQGFELGTQLYQYHHNLNEIFSSEQKKNWQPDYLDPHTLEKTKRYVDSLFTTNKSLRSVSLTVNDGSSLNENNITEENGVFKSNATYLKYVNSVASHLEKKWPKKYIALLAYGDAELPTKSSYKNNVIVFLFKNIKSQYRLWSKHASNFGYYQWYYGKGMIFPNHGPKKLQETLQWCMANDINLFKGEIYGSWSFDGPRTWILSNLMWNVNADVSELQAYYLNKVYGKGAKSVETFFNLAEKVFNTRFEKYDLKFSNRIYPGEYNFLEISPSLVQRLKELIKQSKNEILLAKQANSSHITDLNLFNINNLEFAFNWFEKYFTIYTKLQPFESLEDLSSLEIETKIRDMSWALEQIDGLPEYFSKHLKHRVPFSAYSSNYDIARPRINWLDLEKNALNIFDNIDTCLLRRGKNEEQLKAFWEKQIKEYPNLKFLVSSRLNQKIKSISLVEFKNGFVSNFGKLEPYLNRCFDNSTQFLKEKNIPFIRLQGLGDFIGVKQTVVLKTESVYKVSLRYRTSPGKVESSFTAGFGSGRKIKHKLSSSLDWKEVSFDVSFDSKNRETPNQGAYLIFSLENSNTKKTFLDIDYFKIEQY